MSDGDVFWIAGPKPSGTQPCKTCGLSYSEHTGRLCAICGESFEHHDCQRPNGTDARRHAECVAGRRRMAAARQAAGADLNAIDRACLGASS